MDFVFPVKRGLHDTTHKNSRFCVGGSVLIPVKAHNTPPVPQPPTPTPEQQYIAQIDKANVALNAYLQLPCDSKPEDIKAVIAELTAQVTGLKDAYNGLPKGQDFAVQTRETELILGFVQLENTYVPIEVRACEPPEPATPDSTPVPAPVADERNLKS